MTFIVRHIQGEDRYAYRVIDSATDLPAVRNKPVAGRLTVDAGGFYTHRDAQMVADDLNANVAKVSRGTNCSPDASLALEMLGMGEAKDPEDKENPMTFIVRQINGRYRVVDPATDRIAVRKESSVDGGGYETEEKAQRQADAINRNVQRRKKNQP